MKRSQTSIPAIVSILLSILAPLPGYPCGWGPEGEEIRISLFHPDVASLPGMEPFYFTSRFLNESHPPEEKFHGDHLKNLKEWRSYCGNEVSPEAIDTILSSTDPRDYLAFMEDRSGHPLRNNAFIRYLLKTGNSPALDYLEYAKKWEHLNFNRDPWEDYQWEFDIHAMRLLLEEGKERYAACKDSALQLRYAFQMVRAARYCSQYTACILLYDSLIAPVETENILKYWALAHKASAVYWSGGDPAYSDYLFSLVFRHSEDKVSRAYFGFEGKDLEKTLAFAKNDREKADILALNEIQNPGRSLEILKKIAMLDRDNDKLEMLMTREINKLEDWILTPRLTDMPPVSTFLEINYESDLKYLREVKAFVLAMTPRMENKAFWNLAGAHLSYMDSDFQTASRFLDRARRLSKDRNTDLQVRYTGILIAQNDPALSLAEREKRLFRELQRLEKDSASIRNYGRHFSNLILALCHWYEQRGDLVRAALFHSRVSSVVRFESNRFWNYSSYFYYLDEKATPADLDRLIGLIRKPRKSAFESFLTKEALSDSLRLLDLAGTLYLRQDKLLQALHRYEQIPDVFWDTCQYAYRQYLNANPFHVEPGGDPHRWNEADTVRYNKREMVVRMLEFRQKAAWSKRHKAGYYFRLANAYFNMTYYGNSWMMMRYWWSIHDLHDHSRKNLERKPDNFVYFGCTRARHWYLQAMNASSDPAFRALCLRMAGKCQYRYNIYEGTTKGIRWDEIPQPNPYFDRLEAEHPEQYRQLIEECLGLESYLGVNGVEVVGI